MDQFSQHYPKRKTLRLPYYDYSQHGAYFVTICTQNRKCLFGNVLDDEMRLNEKGQMIENTWKDLVNRFNFVILDIYVIMPNHFHGIMVLKGRGEPRVRPNRRGEPCVHPGTNKDSLGRVIQAFKSITTNEYIKNVKTKNWPRFDEKLWQRDYFDRIIRNEYELDRIREYIVNNPLQWSIDEENPEYLEQLEWIRKFGPIT